MLCECTATAAPTSRTAVLAIAGDADILTTKDMETNEQDEDEETPIYEKYDALLHGNSRKKTDKIVSVAFMKKYIHIAKCIKRAHRGGLRDHH